MEPLDVVARLVGLILDLVPHEEAKALLDDEARKRADAIAALAEAEKFARP